MLQVRTPTATIGHIVLHGPWVHNQWNVAEHKTLDVWSSKVKLFEKEGCDLNRMKSILSRTLIIQTNFR